MEGKPRSTYLDAAGNPIMLKDRSANMQALAVLANYSRDGVSPEALSDYVPDAQALFDAFVKACGGNE